MRLRERRYKSSIEEARRRKNASLGFLEESPPLRKEQRIKSNFTLRKKNQRSGVINVTPQDKGIAANVNIPPSYLEDKANGRVREKDAQDRVYDKSNGDDVTERVRDVYTQPGGPGSFGGVEPLYQELNRQGIEVKKSELTKFLQNLHQYRTFRKTPKIKGQYKRPTVVAAPYYQWQADIMFMKTTINGCKAVLTAVDVFTKRAFVTPLEGKFGPKVAAALERIFTLNGKTPKSLQTDKGKEFYNKDVSRVLKKHNVKLFSSENPDTKASAVERFQRTLKTKLAQLKESNDYTWWDNLPKAVQSYNNSYHDAIKMRPNDVVDSNVNKVRNNLYNGTARYKVYDSGYQGRMRFKVNDLVHILMESGTSFVKRSDNSTYSKEIYRVRNIVGRSYYLEGLKGEDIKGHFYDHELLAVPTIPDKYKVQIVATRQGEVLVRYIDYPEIEPVWVNVNAVEEVHTAPAKKGHHHTATTTLNVRDKK